MISAKPMLLAPDPGGGCTLPRLRHACQSVDDSHKRWGGGNKNAPARCEEKQRQHQHALQNAKHDEVAVIEVRAHPGRRKLGSERPGTDKEVEPSKHIRNNLVHASAANITRTSQTYVFRQMGCLISQQCRIHRGSQTLTDASQDQANQRHGKSLFDDG